MKKEVTMCDHDQCRRVADHRCLLCEHDICDSHAETTLSVIVCARKPAPSQPGVPTVTYASTQAVTEEAPICADCYRGLASVESGSAPQWLRKKVFEASARAMLLEMISTAKAALSEAKLNESNR